MTPHLLLNADIEKPQQWPCGPGNVVLFAQRGPGKEVNQDCMAAFHLSPDTCVLAIADGVGGAPRGDEASRIAIETLRDKLHEAAPDAVLRTIILDAFEAADAAIRALSAGAATTLAVIEIQGTEMRAYHAGDSGFLVTGQRGRQKFKTLFHSPASYAEEAGLITERESMEHPERHIVTSLLGVDGLAVTMAGPIQLARFDTLVAASDGLFDNLSIDEITAVIRKGAAIRAVNTLRENTLLRMSGAEPHKPFKPDDLSLLMFRLAAQPVKGNAE